MLHVYTDSSTKDGKSGIGIVFSRGNKILFTKSKVLENSKSNNRAELEAVLFALEILSKQYPPDKNENVIIHTDNAWVARGLNDLFEFKSHLDLVHKVRAYLKLFDGKVKIEWTDRRDKFIRKADELARQVIN